MRRLARPCIGSTGQEPTDMAGRGDPLDANDLPAAIVKRNATHGSLRKHRDKGTRGTVLKNLRPLSLRDDQWGSRFSRTMAMPFVVVLLMVASPFKVKLPSSSTLKMETCETLPLASITAARSLR